MKLIHFIAASILIIFPISLFAQPKPSIMQTDRQFIIQSAMNFGRDSGGYWDIQNNSNFFKKCLNIQVWNFDEGRDQKYSLVNSPEQGYYEIYTGNNIAFRVSIDSSNTKNGTMVRIKEKKDGADQRFLFQHLGNSRFKIYDKYGRVLSLASNSSINGSNVSVLNAQDGIGDEWFIIDYQTKKAYFPKGDNLSITSSNDNSLNISFDDSKVYKLIANGKENDIKQYFGNVSFDELVRSDNGAIVKAFSKLSTNDKVTHTIWILEEVKNRSLDIKKHAYTELEKVDYNRPSFFLKQMINNYFTNFNEKEVALLETVSALQKKMNK